MAARSETRRVLAEALLIGLAGAVAALIANAVSPRGLKLTTNYFRGDLTPRIASTNNVNATGTNNLSPFEKLSAEFKAKGLQLADSNQVIQLFKDPRREQNLVVFIDARWDEPYRRGHIPGAYLFDHFHPENYLPTVGPVCQNAQQIIVYCDGGSCELSEHTALDLRDIVRVPGEKLFVYGGGYNEWTTNRMPVEAGERQSGKLNFPQ